MDSNVIKEIISGIGNINVIHQYSNYFLSGIKFGASSKI